ncbi:MAG: porin [Pseudomonadota bacterium]
MAALTFAMAGPAEAQTTVGPIRVAVGGYMYQWLGVARGDRKTAPGGRGKAGLLDAKSDAEIRFGGETTLASGITFGFRMQLEANTDDDQIDESYLFIEGAFGHIAIGSENNAAYLRHMSAPEVGIEILKGPSGNDWLVNSTGSSLEDSTFGSTFLRFFDNDAEKITYFTPHLAGFQLGLSYIPHASQDNQGPNVVGSAAGGATAGYHDGFAASLSFARSFGALDLGFALGYLSWQADNNQTAINDPRAWSFGATIGYAGFLLGGSHARIRDGRVGGTSATNAVDGRGWDLGLQYTFGPAAVSLAYFDGRNEDLIAIPGDDRQQTVQLSGRYVLGSGLELRGSLFHTKYQDEAPGAAGDLLDNEGVGAVVGVKLSF